jgi:hypothetical protein
MGKNKPQYYAVTKGSIMSNGLSFGILTKWADCSQHVTGFRGAIYQGCKTLEIAKNIIETAGLLPISVYNYEWIPIAIYLETHLPNTELSDEIDLTDGGSDTDTENEELTTHSSNTGGESEYYDWEKPASTGMTGDVTITNDNDNTVILNEQTLPKVVDSSTNEQIKEKTNCTLCTNPNSEFVIQCFFCKERHIIPALTSLLMSYRVTSNASPDDSCVENVLCQIANFPTVQNPYLQLSMKIIHRQLLINQPHQQLTRT